MSQTSGLLVIDLQYGFTPDPDQVERIRDTSEHYSVTIATRFVNPPHSLFRQVLGDGQDGGAIIDVGHDIILEKAGYGLDASGIALLRTYTGIDSWDLVGSRTGACILACGFSLWDAGIPFRVLRPLCTESPGPLPDAVNAILAHHFRA